ncbi:uncharacterized protein LOC133343615 [Lethenteron reissneri]|uniref:uncharacterized protein LOC133343615 n=1 Tax=Lethenteron reissneri TaxID=7753 RepID=UPI002AB7BB76|nr:uncharacterized protein LOC133343615 [Lethenteron reissneri]
MLPPLLPVVVGGGRPSASAQEPGGTARSDGSLLRCSRCHAAALPALRRRHCALAVPRPASHRAAAVGPAATGTGGAGLRTPPTPHTEEGCPTCKASLLVVKEAAEALSAGPAERRVAVWRHRGGSPAFGLDAEWKFPSLVLFAASTPVMYQGAFVAQAVVDWVEESRGARLERLHGANFENSTRNQQKGAPATWLVMFYEPSCDEVRPLVPVMGAVAAKARSEARVGVVDMDSETTEGLVKRFGVKRGCFPTIILIKQEEVKLKYHRSERIVESGSSLAKGVMYTFNLEKHEVTFDSLMFFLTEGFQAEEGEEVPPPWSPLDEVIDQIASKCKSMFLEDGVCVLDDSEVERLQFKEPGRQKYLTTNIQPQGGRVVAIVLVLVAMFACLGLAYVKLKSWGVLGSWKLE